MIPLLYGLKKVAAGGGRGTATHRHPAATGPQTARPTAAAEETHRQKRAWNVS